jgi:hypothetical protein
MRPPLHSPALPPPLLTSTCAVTRRSRAAAALSLVCSAAAPEEPPELRRAAPISSTGASTSLPRLPVSSPSPPLSSGVFPVRIGGREAVLGSSGEPRRRASPGATAGRPFPPPASPASVRDRPIGADGLDQKGAYPFDPVHGGPMDQVHGRRSTAGVSSHVKLASALASADQSSPATWRHRSPSSGCPGKFANKPPHFWKFQIYPSTI